jgi:hypothetical protein
MNRGAQGINQSARKAKENHPDGAGTVFSSKSFSAPGRHHCNLMPSGFADELRRFFLLFSIAMSPSSHCGVMPGSAPPDGSARQTILLGDLLFYGGVHKTTRMTKRPFFVFAHVADGAIGVRSGSQRPFPTLVAVIINGLPT